MTGANRLPGHSGCAEPSLSSPCAKLGRVDSKPPGRSTEGCRGGMTNQGRVARSHRSEGTILGSVPQHRERRSAYCSVIMRPSIGEPDRVESA
jgi:hypothetical protein